MPHRITSGAAFEQRAWTSFKSSLTIQQPQFILRGIGALRAYASMKRQDADISLRSAQLFNEKAKRIVATI